MLKKFLRTSIPLIAGLIASLGVAVIAGENPIQILSILFYGAFGTPTNLGYTFYYATPLIFSGLAVAWALRTGMFNIGVEGQMSLAGVAIAALGGIGLPSFLAVPTALLTAILSGGIYASLAGFLKAKRGVHEVLSTILLNFISYGIVSFLISVVFRNPNSQVPESHELPPSFWFSTIDLFGSTSPLNQSFLLALLAVALYEIISSKTKIGFLQKLTGEAPGLAKQTGSKIDRQIIFSMFISGAFAGLASINEILGASHKAKEGFSAGVGFVGIAVALIARGKSYGIVFAAVLFGVIHKGCLDLDLDTQYISRDFASVLQGLIILFVCADFGFQSLTKRVNNA